MSLSLNSFPPLNPHVNKTASTSPIHQKREDQIDLRSTIPFISGQCSLDSPQDKLFFSLFTSGWVDQQGTCLKNQSWPYLNTFGQNEYAYLTNILDKPRVIKCQLQNGTICEGHFTLAHLFAHLATFQNIHTSTTVYLIGGELQEVEHKYDWAYTNLQKLSNVEISPLLNEVLKKKTSSDVDFRFFSGDDTTSAQIKSNSEEVITFFAHRVYWNPKNRALRASYDQFLKPYFSCTTEFLAIRNAIRNNGLLKFNFFDSKTEPKTCYTTVAFGSANVKPTDLLFIQSLARNNFFNFDNSKLCLNSIINDVVTKKPSGYLLCPENEKKDLPGMWQHLIDQFCYFIRGHDTQTYDENVYIIYLSHLAKGGQAVDASLEKKLFQKIPSEEMLPELISKYHSKHTNTPEFRQALALKVLFSLRELSRPRAIIAGFWEKICPTLPDATESILGLTVKALKQRGITTESVYQLIHILCLINLGAPNPKQAKQFYIHFNNKEPQFEIIDEFSLTMKGDIVETLKNLEDGLAKINDAKALESLQKIVAYLRPFSPNNPDQETVLKFYEQSLDLNYFQINQISEAWMLNSHPILKLLGKQLSLLCNRNAPTKLLKPETPITIEAERKEHHPNLDGHLITDLPKSQTEADKIKEELNRILDEKQDNRRLDIYSDHVSQLIQFENSSAETYLFNGIQKGIFTNKMQQTLRLCTAICEKHLLAKTPSSAALNFWEKAEKNLIWENCPNPEKNRLLIGIAKQSQQFSPILKIDPQHLQNEEIETIRRFVLEEIFSQLKRNDCIQGSKVARKFSFVLTEQDRLNFLLAKGRKFLGSENWNQSIEVLKELLNSFFKNDEVTLYCLELLEALLNANQETFYSVLMHEKVRSLFANKPTLHSYAFRYLEQKTRINTEVIALLGLFLNGVTKETSLSNEDASKFFNQISLILEQITITLPSEFCQLLDSKKEVLISKTNSPAEMIRFLSCLMYRKIPFVFAIDTYEFIYIRMVTYLNDSKTPENVHQLLLYDQTNLSPSSHLTDTLSLLLNLLIEKKEFQKAENWLSWIEDESLLLNWIEQFIEAKYISPVLPVLEKLKKKTEYYPRVHLLMEKLINHPKIPLIHFLELLIHFNYPVSPLWKETLDRLKSIKKQEPHLLKALHTDPVFLERFKSEPQILKASLLFAMEALSKSHTPYLITFCQNFEFWWPLFQSFEPKERLKVVEELINGLIYFVKPDTMTSEIESFLWNLEEKIEKIYTYTNQKFLPSIPLGLGYKEIIANALMRSNHPQFCQNASLHMSQAVVSRIEQSNLTLDCIRDFEAFTLLAIKKGAASVCIDVYNEHPLHFLSYINLEKLFNTLFDQKNPILEQEFNLLYTTITQFEKIQFDRNTQLALIQFAAKGTEKGSPNLNLISLLSHPVFHTLSHFKAELFCQLFLLQAVKIAQFEEYSRVEETIESLLPRIKNLSLYPQGEIQCLGTAFYLLIAYVGWTENFSQFTSFYAKLLRTACNMPPINSKQTLEMDVIKNGSITFTYLDPLLVGALKDSKDPEKLFKLKTTMIKHLLKSTFLSSDAKTYILEFLWQQILYLWDVFPEKASDIIPIMENALYTCWPSNETNLTYLTLITKCILKGNSTNAFQKKTKELFRLTLYVNLEISDCDIRMLSLENLINEALKVIERMLTTQNSYQISRSILLLKNFHRVLPKNDSFFLENHPVKMMKIYEDLIDFVQKNPFYQFLDAIREGNHIEKPTIKYAAYHNLSLMLLLNPYFTYNKWKQHVVSLANKWVKTLSELIENNLNAPECFELYHCMRFFMQNMAEKGIFKDFIPSYCKLVDVTVDNYIKILQTDKSLSKENLAPYELFQISMKEKEKVFLNKVYEKCLKFSKG